MSQLPSCDAGFILFGSLAYDRALLLDVTGWRRTHSISWPQSDKAATISSSDNQEQLAELRAVFWPAVRQIDSRSEEVVIPPTLIFPTPPRHASREPCSTFVSEATDVRQTRVRQDTLAPNVSRFGSLELVNAPAPIVYATLPVKLVVGGKGEPFFIHRGLFSKMPALKEKLDSAIIDCSAIAVPDIEPPMMAAVCAFLYKGVVEWPDGSTLSAAHGKHDGAAGAADGPSTNDSGATLQKRISLYVHARSLGFGELASIVAATLSPSELVTEQDMLGIGQLLSDKMPGGDAWLEGFFEECFDLCLARNPRLAISGAVLMIIKRGGLFAAQLHGMLALRMLSNMKIPQ